MNDEEWFLMIGREIGQQIPLYINSPAEKVRTILLRVISYECVSPRTFHGHSYSKM